MAVSAFNKMRANNSDLADLNPEDFDISEALLNQALANITISALSLGTWYDNVHGSSTRVFNVYHFHNRLSFYLPYGLCLLLTFPVRVLGLLALQHNDVTAVDGGFVQLLMTTTRRTDLEDAAARGYLGGEENVPLEMRMMEVRFGEMITGDASERERLLPSRTSGRDEYVSATDGTSVSYSDRSDLGLDSDTSCSAQEMPDPGGSVAFDQTAGQADGVKLASGAETGEAHRLVMQRAGFGLLAETIPFEKSVRYGRPGAGTQATSAV
jgi:hypothetical protein